MYLSCLLVDVGANPDRPRPGRLWLRNLYRVHQRLCMAFPTKACKTDDPAFLQPYDPDRFGHVHTPRTVDSAFLFRLDPQPGGNPVIVVQSAIEPDWDYAFHNAAYLLAAAPETRPFEPGFAAGRRLRFRLKANPTKKKDTLTKEDRLNKLPGRHGRRVPVPTDHLCKWLDRRAESGGFRLKDQPAIEVGYVYLNANPSAGGGQRLRSVLYDGVLEVADADRFRETLICGIGPAKAFGFGLLSVAPVR
ncbi:MAG: type I-E CRISPR-associated protein Cas6/Cse3/CasE [Phycisphaerae bacterium]|nr:type I-E CRISPR-associated protein Cas6/Cse3/CasE [Phycisphaerae bacterium]